MFVLPPKLYEFQEEDSFMTLNHGLTLNIETFCNGAKCSSLINLKLAQLESREIRPDLANLGLIESVGYKSKK